MSILKPVVYDGQLQKQVAAGDKLASMEVIPATIVTNAITITGSQLGSGMILRNPTAAATDTIDSAANVIAAIQSGLGNSGLQPGTSWRCTWIVTTAFATTVQATANTGVTVTRGTINASSTKDFLVTIVNGTPAQTFAALTTNASAVISGLTQAQLATLSVGMVVTNAVNGLQGTTISAINLAAGTVTLSGNANATSSTPVAISFSPVIKLEGIGQGLI